MKKYRVDITKVCHGYVIVEADNEDEAREKASDMDIEDEYTNKEEVTETGNIEIEEEDDEE